MRFYGFDVSEIVEEEAGMLPLDIDPKAGVGAAPPRSLPARRQPRQPRGVAAGARLRRQGGRPHHRDAAARRRSASATSPGCISRGTRRCRSSFCPTTGRRRICSTARGWRSGFGRKRRNWDLDFENAKPSWPGLSRPSTSCWTAKKKDVDARDKPGHDKNMEFACTSLLSPAKPISRAGVKRPARWP